MDINIKIDDQGLRNTLASLVGRGEGVSARASNRILRVARTIADLADVDRLNESHLLEAMGYRSMDKLFKN